jgi:hypothetical protein
MFKLRILLTASIFVLSVSLLGCMVLLDSGDSKNKNERPAQLPQVTAADEMSAKVRLISIAKAETLYQAETGGEYATLEALIQKGLVADPSRGQFAWYKFEVKLRPNGFDATAVPEKYGVTGTRSFFIDETNTLHAADKNGEKATAQDPPA